MSLLDSLMELETLQKELKRQQAQRSHEIYCCEYVKITDKKGTQVPFLFNVIQEKINKTIIELRKQKKRIRIIILKARQEGVSTFTQALMLHGTATKENKVGLVVAHRDDATRTVFQKAKYMYNNLPEDIRPLQQASNERALVFDRPSRYSGDREGLNSKMVIATAGGEGVARGSTLNFVHLSEFAFYPGEPIKDILSPINAALSKEDPDAWLIIESTANGYNDFKVLWDQSVIGENDYTPLFFAWHDFPEYMMEIVSEEERQQIRESYNDYEKNIASTFGLTEEQIKWYRWTLRNDCGGDVDMMKQENPSFPEEAFLSTGRPVFPIDVVEARLLHLRKVYLEEPPIQGEMEYVYDEEKGVMDDAKVRFVPDRRGRLFIYKEPVWGHPYIIGGDIAEGGHDFCAMDVIDNSTGEQVAVFRGHMDTDIFAKYIYSLGKYYNYALLTIEVNFDTHPVKELERLKYFNMYIRQQLEKYTNKFQDKYGWITNSKTRPIMIGNLVEIIRDSPELFNDIRTLQEMLVFVRDDRGRPAAQAGQFDDLIFAAGIARMATSQQTTVVKLPKREVHPLEAFKNKLSKGTTEKRIM